MSYDTKSAIVMTVAFTISIITAFVVACAMFAATGAYMPDGFSLNGLVYGVSDLDAVFAISTAVVTMIAAMVGTITVGEKVIA